MQTGSGVKVEIRGTIVLKGKETIAIRFSDNGIPFQVTVPERMCVSIPPLVVKKGDLLTWTGKDGVSVTGKLLQLPKKEDYDNSIVRLDIAEKVYVEVPFKECVPVEPPPAEIPSPLPDGSLKVGTLVRLEEHPGKAYWSYSMERFVGKEARIVTFVAGRDRPAARVDIDKGQHNWWLDCLTPLPDPKGQAQK